MFINNFDPVAFDFNYFQVRWYSIAYILGIVLGWLYCKKKLIVDIKIANLFDDLLAYIIIGIIIGGRLGYVLIYNFKLDFLSGLNRSNGFDEGIQSKFV